MGRVFETSALTWAVIVEWILARISTQDLRDLGRKLFVQSIEASLQSVLEYERLWCHHRANLVQVQSTNRWQNGEDVQLRIEWNNWKKHTLSKRWFSCWPWPKCRTVARESSIGSFKFVHGRLYILKIDKHSTALLCFLFQFGGLSPRDCQRTLHEESHVS